MAMMGIGSLVSQPSVNEAISRVVTPVIDPITQNILPTITDPLSTLIDPASKILGEVISYTPVGMLADLVSLAFDKPESIWEPDDSANDMIDQATRDRIAIVMEWQLFGDKALQPWHGLEVFQELELQMYGQHDPSGELPEPMYADALYDLQKENDALSHHENILDEQARTVIDECSQIGP